MSSVPIAWTIAGSDSCAGAGIQADIKTMQSFSVYCASVVTSVTAQNTQKVMEVSHLSAALVGAQLNALQSDMIPSAVKIGMVGSAEVAEKLVQLLGGANFPIVYDPVMVATSGDVLLDDDALDIVLNRLVPLADLVTPNWAEAHVLAGLSHSVPCDLEGEELDQYIESLARAILSRGARSVLVKGGHLTGEYVQDFWTDGRAKAWLSSPRQVVKNTHGTGCTLSSALAASLANGLDILDAVVMAKAYVNQALRLAPAIGCGKGPLAHLGLMFREQDLPWLTLSAGEGRKRPDFARDSSLGFYPIVPDSAWVEKVAAAGAKTVQLRIKNQSESFVEQEIARAIEIARRYCCNLYINDFWQLALKYQAYGVHLGQEDLEDADVNAIAASGLKLGVSTHCYQEVARALSVRPSYIAIGPVFPTTTKEMKFAPQGLSGLSKWATMLNYPLVAIGGITLGVAASALDSGANGIAVVRDILDNADPSLRVVQWMQSFSNWHQNRKVS
ncbi:MAG: bifunctional hydroxymethylpyrimidine kinase/phosphomethylpyrimidine kinase [Candidatus Obscuribacterales bacterium]